MGLAASESRSQVAYSVTYSESRRRPLLEGQVEEALAEGSDRPLLELGRPVEYLRHVVGLFKLQLLEGLLLLVDSGVFLWGDGVRHGFSLITIPVVVRAGRWSGSRGRGALVKDPIDSVVVEETKVGHLLRQMVAD